MSEKELSKHEVEILNTYERKKRLLKMWADVEYVCQAIVEKTKEDPKEIKASLLKEAINGFKALKEMDTYADELDRELKHLEERGGDPDGMTSEEMMAMDQAEVALADVEARMGDPETWKEK